MLNISLENLFEEFFLKMELNTLISFFPIAISLGVI